MKLRKDMTLGEVARYIVDGAPRRKGKSDGNGKSRGASGSGDNGGDDDGDGSGGERKGKRKRGFWAELWSDEGE